MWKETFLGTGRHDYLVTTGVHGDETGGVLLGIKLVKHLKYHNKNFKSITLLHAINETGIVKCQREYQDITTNDINRLLNSDKWITKNRIEDILIEEIAKADVVIDIHNSPIVKDCFVLNLDDKANNYRKFFDECNFNYYPIFSGTNTIKKYSCDLGKIGFTYETNGMSGGDVKIYRDDLNDILTLIGRIDNIVNLDQYFNTNLSYPQIQPIFEFKSIKSGVFYIDEHFRSKISEGEKLGIIIDVQTGIITDVKYKGDSGVILSYETNKYVKEGDTLAYININ